MTAVDRVDTSIIFVVIELLVDSAGIVVVATNKKKSRNGCEVGAYD